MTGAGQPLASAGAGLEMRAVYAAGTKAIVENAGRADDYEVRSGSDGSRRSAVIRRNQRGSRRRIR